MIYERGQPCLFRLDFQEQRYDSADVEIRLTAAWAMGLIVKLRRFFRNRSSSGGFPPISSATKNHRRLYICEVDVLTNHTLET